MKNDSGHVAVPVETSTDTSVQPAKPTMVYVSSVEGMPGFCAASIDEPSDVKENAKLVAKWIREGRTVGRVTVDEARNGLSLYMDARIAVRAAKA